MNVLLIIMLIVQAATLGLIMRLFERLELHEEGLELLAKGLDHLDRRRLS